jgi:hypothetical protein
MQPSSAWWHRHLLQSAGHLRGFLVRSLEFQKFPDSVTACFGSEADVVTRQLRVRPVRLLPWVSLLDDLRGN